MLRKVVGAAVILAVCVGVAVAEDIAGRITKIGDGKVTFEKKGKDKGTFEDAKTYDLAKDVKVSKKGKDGNVAVADGLKAEALQKIGEKGVGAIISVNDDKKVTEIILTGGKKKAAQ